MVAALVAAGRLGVHRRHFSLQLLDVFFADGDVGHALPGELDEVGGAVDTIFAQVYEALHDVVGMPAGLAPSVASAAVVAANN